MFISTSFKSVLQQNISSTLALIQILLSDDGDHWNGALFAIHLSNVKAL
jgi:hypothetical protein